MFELLILSVMIALGAWSVGLVTPADLANPPGKALAAIMLVLAGFSAVAFAAWTVLPGTRNLEAANVCMQREIAVRDNPGGNVLELNGLIKSIAVAANESKIFDDAVNTLLREVCTFTGWAVGHAVVFANGIAEQADFWHLADPLRYHEFVAATTGYRYGDSADPLVSLVFQTRKPVRCPEFLSEDISTRIRAGLRCGLVAGISQPVFIRYRVVAVVEFLSERSLETGTELQKALETSVDQVAQVMERNITEKQIRSLNAELEQRVAESTAELERAVVRMERQNREITLGNEMGNLLQACLSTDEAGELTVRFVSLAFPGSSGTGI